MIDRASHARSSRERARPRSGRRPGLPPSAGRCALALIFGLLAVAGSGSGTSARVAGAAAPSPLLAGCSSTVESVVLIGGETVDAATIDRDPLALLPGGVILLSYLDAATLWKTELGPDVGKLTQNLIPLGPSANFVPSRDVARIYGGVYAMQGADFCMVVQGQFDVESIERAAEARALATNGAPLVKTKYAGNEIYTAGNVGFVVLTANTLLSGNETGMRRALDRLRFNKLSRAMPIWMSELTITPNASFTLAGDFTGQVPLDALASQAPFMAGLRQMRILGNFQPPGMNLAGTLSYADAPTATTGAQSLRSVQSFTQLLGILSSFGFGGSLPPMQVGQQGSDVQFTLPVDSRYASFLIRLGIAATTPTTLGASTATSGR